jgi:toxin ParE1/3/4
MGSMAHDVEYEVILETTAVIDLRGVFDYITDDIKAPEAAERVYLSIKKQILKLDHMPARYNIVQDEPYASFGVRLMPVENYYAFFIINEQEREVHVFRILYKRREWQNILPVDRDSYLS